MDVITPADLASHLRDPDLTPQVAQVVADTNELITEKWATPVTPVPATVRLLALRVATRAWSYDPSQAHIESVSRSIQDASRTERFRSTFGEGGVYLTSAELATLRGGSRARSVRLVLPGGLA